MRPGSMVIWDQRMAHGSYRNRSSRMRCAQFIKIFPRKAVDNPERANARALVLRKEISALKGRFEVSELGEKLFGLDMVTDAKDPPEMHSTAASSQNNTNTRNNNNAVNGNNNTNNNVKRNVPFKPRLPKNSKK